METAKPSINYRYGQYDIELTLFGERKLSITVIDTLERLEYFEKDVVLEAIGANTLVKAFEQTKQEIQVAFSKTNMAENDLLQLKVTVESPFLKPLVETILLKKLREVSEEETVRHALDHLSRKVKELKESNENSNIKTYYGAVLEQRSYSSANYETLASVRLPKGKYLLTLNFLVKATNSWIYLYLNQGVSLMQNAGFYVPSAAHFIPHTVRKIHQVTADHENVCFSTYYGNSYPILVRNAIVTAKPLPE
jgi:hypothetical protein